MSDGAFRLLAGLFEARTGQRLQPERRWRIEAALGTLVREHDLLGPDQLALRAVGGDHPALAEAVVDALLNNETSFFRDQPAFALIETRGLARLARARATERRLSIWSAGCSTGQEAYSLAMLFARDPDRWAGWRIDIVGTDVSPAAVAFARAGRYGHFEIQRGLAMADMVRWFDRDGDSWQANAALRDMVRFEVRNLLDAPPGAVRFDMILCRNVLFYFPAAVRRAVFDRLATAIRPDGVLVLGAGETVMGQSEAFVSDYEARGLYRPALPETAAALRTGLARGGGAG